MWNVKKLAGSLAISSLVLLAFGGRHWLQDGNTWTIDFGDPSRSGTHETTLRINYTDSNGAQQEKVITSSIPLASSDNSSQKKEAAQDKLHQELNKDENKVNGQPLATLGGTGDVMTVTPNSSVPDAKIKSINTNDSQTGEEDVIHKPNKKALAQVTPVGELLGRTSDGGPSVFFVTTNLGLASVQLSPGMSKLELLKALKAGLLAQDPDAPVWVDTSLGVLFVMLPEYDEESICSIGAGSTDLGLSAVCKVMITD